VSENALRLQDILNAFSISFNVYGFFGNTSEAFVFLLRKNAGLHIVG